MSDAEHPILTAAGVLAVAVGLLFVFQPRLASAIGTGYAAVTVVGLLALVQAVRVARSRQASDLRAAETDDVETVESMPTPGDEFDRTVAELRSGPRRVLIRERADLRDALEEAARTAVANRENCSREQAAERIEAGAWTDDVHAAAFLGGSEAPSPPILDRVKIAASGESPFQFRIRRTADAVAQAAGVEADAGDEADESDGGVGSPGPGDSGTGGDAAGDGYSGGDTGGGDPGSDSAGGDRTDGEEPETGTDERRTDEETDARRDDSARPTEVEA